MIAGQEDVLTTADKELLIDAAWRAIKKGVGQEHVPLRTPPPGSAVLRPGASFVTLTMAGRLRGCIGTLESCQPLIDDVIENSGRAAFHDPRFPPVEAAEVIQLNLEVSVLSAPRLVTATSRSDLLGQLHPLEDGLTICDRGRKATFLPAVWKSLPQPERFLDELLIKAGLPKGHWSASMEIYRYSTHSFASK